MQDFEYVAPTTLDEAVRLMAESGPNAKALAGGTDVIVQLRGGRFQIERLVDVKKVPEMNELSYSEANGLTVGAAVPCCLIYENETVIKHYPGLVDAAFLIGGIQIQARATLGGNLCNSSPSGDTIPALMVLGGIADVAGPNGRRSIPIEEFCTAPGRNQLQDGELLVSMNFPAPKPNSGAAFLRFIPRNEMDIAIANSGVSVISGRRQGEGRFGKDSGGSRSPYPQDGPGCRRRNGRERGQRGYHRRGR